MQHDHGRRVRWTSTAVFDDPTGTFAGAFAVGDPVSGQFSFDSGAIASATFPNYAAYPAAFSATVSGQAFSGPAEYRIFNDDPTGGDGVSVINETGTYTGPSLGDLVPSTFFVQFLGMPTTTLTDFSLVTDPVSLVPLSDPLNAPHGLRMESSHDESFGFLYFTIDSVTTAPDSGGLSLMALGLIALGCTRKAIGLRNHCSGASEPV